MNSASEDAIGSDGVVTQIGSFNDGDPSRIRRYEVDVDIDDDGAGNNSYSKLHHLIGRDKRVLELGCSTGRTTAALRARGCSVVAVELDAEAAALASPHCERLIAADLETFGSASELIGEEFDVILAADVLEHVRDPGGLLRRVLPHLARRGRLVVSVPNVAHASVRLALLDGRFEYGETGLLDRTHVHLFTRASLERMLEEELGLTPIAFERVTRPVDGTEVTVDVMTVDPHVLALVEADPEALTYQFVAAYELPGVDRFTPPPTGPPVADVAGAVVSAQARQLRDLQSRLDVVTSQLRAKDAELRGILDSRGWRVVRALRRVRRLGAWGVARLRRSG